MNVLVIDDAPAVRTRLAALLRDVAGVEHVSEAATGDAALAIARSLLPRVVVIDLHLANESALAVLPRFKAEQAQATLIVVTNDASDTHRRACVARGADFFFDKSRDFERVVDVVAEASAHDRRAR